jgi:hypothetical protein
MQTAQQITSEINAAEYSKIVGVCCTDYAEWCRNLLGGGVICGFHDHENPGTLPGRVAGGHDFLVLYDRFVVDLWLREVMQWTEQIVFDVKSQKDREAIKHYHGEANKWTIVNR